ncbi:DEAD/DEAH box helicase [Bacillus sp. REN16]|uniref:DEAD/DEAH box helicase n=1 Tax=Bacillus sp. REN16 TaxID=2887296 RepID=UPI001E51205B|nr:DEAD/DEAH box helicase [Bacillus sp. REN16]MCC3358509.1 DEAD/DEAH box helicase [Bacillus sp. REN16]
MNGFEQFKLNDEIVKALTGLGYKAPTEIQAKVIPIALMKKDIVGKSQTGSGKTAAFAIPICELVEWEENKPQALILTPTRELAAQVKDDVINIGRFKRIKATAIYGKQSYERQKLELKQKTHVVVGTPGRVLDHLQKGTLHVENLKFLVIDEADEMLNMGFIEQVEAIIKALPENRVTMLFSATLPEDIENLSVQYMKSPVHIDVENITKSNIHHFLIHTEEEDKLSLLKDVTMVENPDSCIIFCRTQQGVDELYRKLEKANYSCDKLHGNMIQEDRFAVMDDFKKGKFRYLVATDIAARGIDVENISLVISFDVPQDKERYVHRIGRTGRAGKTGKAITFATSNEENIVKEIEEYIGEKISRIEPPSSAEVARAKSAFAEKMNSKPRLKHDKTEKINKDIVKLYFNGGKKKKLRVVDFVGTIAKIPGVTAEDIGIITIQENATYVDILNGKGQVVLAAMKHTTIKGKQLKVHIAR